MRGIRLNLSTGGTDSPSVAGQLLRTAAERVKGRNWYIQIYTNLAMIVAIQDLIASSPVPIVFDHFGGAQAALGPEQPGFSDLLKLVASGRAYVKLSGPYRVSRREPPYVDV